MKEEIATDTNSEKIVNTKFSRFCLKHGINPNLIMLKITLFVMYGATSSLLPYLTIHMQSIGLTVEEIAIIYLALPFTTFLSPPITGFLVDKFGKYKPVVVMSLLLNAIFHHSLLYIPQQEIPGIMPSAYIMGGANGRVEVWWSPCPSRECPKRLEMDLTVDQCLDHCLLLEPNPKIEIAPTISPLLNIPMDNGNNIGLHVSRKKFLEPSTTLKPNSISSQTLTTTSKIPGVSLLESSTAQMATTPPPLPASTAQMSSSPTHQPSSTAQEHLSSAQTFSTPAQILSTIAHIYSTTAQISLTTAQTPLEILSSTFNEFNDTFPNILEKTLNETEEMLALNNSAFFRLDMHPNLAPPIEQLGIEIEKDENGTVTDFKHTLGEKFLWAAGVNVTELEEEDLRCGGVVLNSNMTQTVGDCIVQKCRFKINGPEICPPDYIESDDKVFWLYFLLRFLATTMLSAGVTIMDPIALTMIEKYGGDFGRERLFSSIGMAIFSPITGIMIDYSSRGLGYTDYSAAFYTYDILLTISTISVLLMPLGEKLPADNVFRDLWNLLKMPHVIAFILFLFALGNFWGFIESFLFLYLKELGAPNYLLGITITVGTVSSLPFLYGAEKITRIFGHVNLIIIAFFSHAGRLVGYSFIENAWWCFPFEAMESLSCHLMWVAAATYCSILAPKNLLATLIGVLGMAHFSLGRGSGSFTGGILIGQFGTRDAFRYMGLLAVVGGIAYGLLHLIWLRKFDNQMDDDDREDTDAAENGENEKLTEGKTRDQGTSMSQERLSLMIKYNQIGSLTSLPRGSRVDIHDHLSHRRSSYNIDTVKIGKGGGGSASKVDLLKSALEINHKVSNNSVLSKLDKTSNQSLGRNRADSAPKLSHANMKNISHPTLEAVVLEGVESTFFPSRMKKYPSGMLPIIPAMDFKPSTAVIPDEERRESIPEEVEMNGSKKHSIDSSAQQTKRIYPSISKEINESTT